MLSLLAGMALASPRLDALAAEAEQVFPDDPARASRLAERVLRRDPGHAQARYVQSLVYAAVADRIPDPTARELARSVVVADLEHVVRVAPDQGFARDAWATLDALGVAPVLARPVPTCPPEAESSHRDADTAFAHGDVATARHWYRKALEDCPDHAGWWVDAGRAWMPAEPEMALLHDDTAIEHVPCWVDAHLERATILAAQGDAAQARLAAIDAVACDPGDARGWELGRSAPLLVPPVPPQTLEEARSAGPGWEAWWQAREASTAAPAERALAAAEAGLAADRGHDPTWAVLRAARADGTLATAVLVLPFTPDLGPVVDAPARHAELVAWLEAHLFP